ncbi:MAG TPA: hypothetical protein VME92_06880 [Acetobacteraceae bacterium]|nr:hypothetical protein [Acetobacteraceae bacterium]
MTPLLLEGVVSAREADIRAGRFPDGRCSRWSATRHGASVGALDCGMMTGVRISMSIEIRTAPAGADGLIR